MPGIIFMLGCALIPSFALSNVACVLTAVVVFSDFERLLSVSLVFRTVGDIFLRLSRNSRKGNSGGTGNDVRDSQADNRWWQPYWILGSRTFIASFGFVFSPTGK